MAETTFKSPGVTTREIDLTGPTSTSPSGIPAGVIGISEQGPAFVPVTVGTFADFVAKFGGVSADRFGPMAIQQWLRNRTAGLFIRTLGVGDGKKRNADGTVTNAGFVVGQQLPQPDTADAGKLGRNPYAGSTTSGAKATVSLTVTAGAFQDNAKFTINVPTSQGGEGGNIIIRYKDGGPNAAQNNQIVIKRDVGGVAVDAENLAQLLVFAINGTEPSGVVPSTGGSFAAGDVVFANAATRGENGVLGVTASRVGAVVTITCDTVGDDGNEVVLTDDTHTPIATAAGASPKNLAGGANLNGLEGRAYMLGVVMSGSLNSDFIADAGLSTTLTSGRFDQVQRNAGAGLRLGGKVNQHTLLRGVLLAPSGVVPALSASRDSAGNPNSTGNQIPLGSSVGKNLAGSNIFGDDSTDNAGSSLGALNIHNGKQEFVLYLNGHLHTAAHPTIITASMDPQSPNYMSNVLNTDPSKIQLAGHCLYADFPVYSAMAVPTGSLLNSDANVRAISADFQLDGATTREANAGQQLEDIVFLVTSSLARNVGSATKPNYENFRTRFSTAVSPFVISQKFGGVRQNLFRVHSLDDGAIGNQKVKISIENIIKSKNKVAPFGQFDLLVRSFTDSDSNPVVLEKFTKISLDPNDERFISRVIGDQKAFYDFDKAEGAQKLVVQGAYPNASNYIRVEVSKNLEDGQVPAEALPVGFRGVQHLVTSGSSIFTGPSSNNEFAVSQYDQLVQPPIPMRRSLATGKGKKQKINSSLYWGVQWEYIDNVKQPNKNVAHDPIVYAYTKWFPNHLTDVQDVLVGNNEGLADSAGTIYDADRFNNSLFTLEKIQVVTTAADKASASQWAAARYKRDGALGDFAGTAKATKSGAIKTTNFATGDNFTILVPSAAGGSGTAVTFTLADGAAGAAANTIKIDTNGLSDTQIAAAIAAAINGQQLNSDIVFSSNANGAIGAGVQGIVASSSGELVTITAVNHGVAGNTVTLTDGSQGSLVEDGSGTASATLAGGSAGSLLDIDGNATTQVRFLSVEKDFGQPSARRFLKFTFPLQGGFDGLNILDVEKAKMSDVAARREVNDSSQGGVFGPTVGAFRTAIDILGTKSDADINLLAIPGMRHESITDYALQATEERFDALLLMDIEEKDNVNTFVTGSDQDISVTNTVDAFKLRNLDSSFGAAYFPDVLHRDTASGKVFRVPPTVSVLGAFALNDSVAHPWFAPAGFTRGAMSDVQEAQVKLSRSNMDALYESDINPIAAFPSSPGTVVFGQKTLLAAQSALDRVNVRRLLIDIRRKVKRVGDTFLFEPNRESTLAAFSAAVEPILSRIQQQQGLERFKVQIDTSTTTQADIENNTVRGKIFLQPVRSVEFISLDFVVTNAGMDI